MLKAREILRLKHQAGLSLREIAKACSCGKSTVSEILSRAEKAGINWPIDHFSDKQLMAVLYPPTDSRTSPPEPDMEYIFSEMKKKSFNALFRRSYRKNIFGRFRRRITHLHL